MSKRDDIWASIARFDEANQAKCKIRDNDAQVSKLQNECGGCSMWMTQQCPREKGGIKVSCGQAKCAEFIMQDWVKNLIEKLEHENVNLAATIAGPTDTH
jgi:hypothetical protein